MVNYFLDRQYIHYIEYHRTLLLLPKYTHYLKLDLISVHSILYCCIYLDCIVSAQVVILSEQLGEGGVGLTKE